jgi:hypothetical protein
LPAPALIAVLSAVAVALIMFFPFTKLLAEPIGGMVALGVVLLTLVGGVRAPGNVPVVPLAVLLGAACIGVAASVWLSHAAARGLGRMSSGCTCRALDLQFFSAAADGVALPADRACRSRLVTVIGGVDNVESARRGRRPLPHP